jgi:hypothetical protein
MRSAVLLFIVALGCISTQHDPRLYGAWKSNYDLTVAEFKKVPGITSEQLTALSDPELFGHMVQVYAPGEAIVIYEGECTRTAYEIVERADSYVDIRYYDEFNEEQTTKRIFFEPGAIWLRVGKAREIFSKVDLEAIANEYECLTPLVDAIAETSAG